MMQLPVDVADAGWKHIEGSGLAANYPTITVKPPAMQPWGRRVHSLTDPTGILRHIADQRSA